MILEKKTAAMLNSYAKSGATWVGYFQGWDGEYIPSDPTPPPGSKMTFTPAEFVLGDSRVWFFGRMWEAGDDQPPSETCNGPAAGQAVGVEKAVVWV
jgi:hypothetical protein